MRTRQYLFIVDVQEDGVIDVDWGGSYSETIEVGTGKVVPDPDPIEWPEILDGVLGYTEVDGKTIAPSKPQALRNLADYMEAHQ